LYPYLSVVSCCCCLRIQCATLRDTLPPMGTIAQDLGNCESFIKCYFALMKSQAEIHYYTSSESLLFSSYAAILHHTDHCCSKHDTRTIDYRPGYFSKPWLLPFRVQQFRTQSDDLSYRHTTVMWISRKTESFGNIFKATVPSTAIGCALLYV
jgi:hypothetical protein